MTGCVIEMSKEEEKGRHKELSAYCGRLIEDHEDDLVEAIQNGFDETTGAPVVWQYEQSMVTAWSSFAELVDVLCLRLAKACDGSAAPHVEL